LLHAFALNNDAVEGVDKTLKGDSTETALMEISREQNIQPGIWPRLSEIPFDADRKMMTTFHSHDNKIISFTKGAPDILLQRCAYIDLAAMQKQVNDMAARGHRILGFAYRYWDVLPENPNSESHETGLHFLGLAGIIDPPREEVFEAVGQCKTAGIVPVMITGDHPLTAKTIAQRIGILNNENDMVITGQQLAALDDDSFLSKVEKIKVYARVSPEQKLQIVKMLQQKGHYVAMTGDGVNDAPSLKRANIGIAMGITGTDVSKEAAHMILLDDNFSTIVKAVREGRRIYDNILKFIKYLMTTNSSELLVLLLGPILGLPIALLPIHILWINLVSDGLPAISLSFEKEENRKTLSLAEAIRSKRHFEIQNGIYGFQDQSKMKGSFLRYVEYLAEKRKDSKGNYDNWDSTLKHLQKFVKTDVSFSQIDKKWLENQANARKMTDLDEYKDLTPDEKNLDWLKEKAK
jgi:Ca2+-transporting ATPase